VQDSHKAYARALDWARSRWRCPTGPMELRLPAIKGIGGAPLYLIDRFEDGKSIYDIDFDSLPASSATRGPRPEDRRPPDAQRLPRPHGVLGGVLREAVQLPRDRYFDIKGEYTGLTSKAMTAPDGRSASR
jgi:4-hydroxyphenylpyruvate dioxygenase